MTFEIFLAEKWQAFFWASPDPNGSFKAAISKLPSQTAVSKLLLEHLDKAQNSKIDSREAATFSWCLKLTGGQITGSENKRATNLVYAYLMFVIYVFFTYI